MAGELRILLTRSDNDTGGNMNVRENLAATGGLRSIASELGLSDEEVQRGAEALLPAVLGGFKHRATSSAANEPGFGGMLDQLGGEALLDNVLAAAPTDVDRGNDVLGRIFGTRDVSRSVAQHAAARSGLSTDLLKQMLPRLAMVVAGYIAQKHGGAAAALPRPRAGNGSLGGLGSMLDLDGDGNPLDDVLGMVQRSMR